MVHFSETLNNCLYLFYYFMHMNVLLEVYESATHEFLVSKEVRRGHKSPWDCGSSGTKVIDSCEPPCGFWELNLCPLQEQQLLLIPEPTLQSSFQLDFKELI